MAIENSMPSEVLGLRGTIVELDDGVDEVET
jgi:hypothetical protein